MKTAYAYIHASTTKNHDYLTIRFSCYSFFSLRNVLFFTKAIPLDLNRIYIIPLNLPWSLFAPLHLLGNHCCCNKPIDMLISQTLLYYYRVIRERPLLAPLLFIAISFTTWNWFSIFWLISQWVTALRPFYIKSSVL